MAWRSRLYWTCSVSVVVALVLVALLARPGGGLRPARSSAFQLDELQAPPQRR